MNGGFCLVFALSALSKRAEEGKIHANEHICDGISTHIAWKRSPQLGIRLNADTTSIVELS
ncbi:hypothetical protein Ancab_030401 [Ancistrocladus abbreviatus]